jgi:lysozyme family protein|tara:strand:- start:930 stop:1478 length:549 start_codon:yes stop_codon:yes gene_type:complete
MVRAQVGVFDRWTVDKTLDFVIDNFEGTKFVDHPDDRGGPTKFGITKKALSKMRGRAVRNDDIHKLTRVEAKSIYVSDYVEPVWAGKMSYGPLRLAVVDWSIHSGAKRVVKAIQEIVEVTTDGIMGPITWAAISGHEPRSMFLRVMAARTVFLSRLVARDNSQVVFLYGWGRRLAKILESAA